MSEQKWEREKGRELCKLVSHLHSYDGLPSVVVGGRYGCMVDPLLQLFEPFLRRRGNKHDPGRGNEGGG